MNRYAEAPNISQDFHVGPSDLSTDFLCKFQVKPKWQVKQKEVGWDPWGPWDEFFLLRESIFPTLKEHGTSLSEVQRDRKRKPQGIFPVTCSFLGDNKRTGANGSKQNCQTPSDLLILMSLLQKEAAPVKVNAYHVAVQFTTIGSKFVLARP